MQIRKFNSQQTMQWLKCGLRFWRRAPVAWSTVALIDLILIYLFEQIPVIGDVVLLFLAPAALVSGMRFTRGNTTNNGATPARTLNQRLMTPAHAAFGVFGGGNEAIAAVLIGLVIMAAGLLLEIVFQILGGAAVVQPVPLYSMGIVNALHYLGAYLATWALIAPIFVIVIYSMPLFFLEDLPLPEALGLALRALLRNGIALVPFVGSLFAPLFVAILAFKIYWYGGLVLTAVAGFITIPLWINSAYCSYKLTFH